MIYKLTFFSKKKKSHCIDVESVSNCGTERGSINGIPIIGNVGGVLGFVEYKTKSNGVFSSLYSKSGVDVCGYSDSGGKHSF